MHSFSDIHDFDDAGRASYPNYSINSASSTRTAFLLPLELKCSPIPSLQSTIDTTPLQQPASIDETVPQLAAFLPVARLPLILADSARESGGSSEFQSNAALPFDSYGNISEAFARETNGLGVALNSDKNVSDERPTVCAAERAQVLAMDGFFPDFVDLPAPYSCFSLEEPFDELGDIKFMSGMLLERNSDRRLPGTFLAQTSAIPEKMDYSFSFEKPDSARLFNTSCSFKGQSSPRGLVADINMFDKENASSVCVKPQDLVGQDVVQNTLQTESSRKLKMENVSEDRAELIRSPSASPKYLKAPEPDWPQIPTEHLPFLVERYLAHFVPDATPMEYDANKQDMKPSVPVDPVIPPYTPITAEILEAVEEAQCTREPQIRKLTDKTNVSRPRITSRTGGNAMEMYDFLVPQNVTLEKPYEGVPITSVVQKTKYFLMTNPGERLSEELLFSFAGRLDYFGQQMPGYRCYVQDCSKTTKRKDHMADHVRTHLGEKPFQCSVCGMGFIRNNDCQRHENNHRPDKKFVCACKAAFSRRDLFVRHQKTVCALSDGPSMSRCFRRPRKFIKAPSAERKGTPDGDDENDLDYIPRDARCAVISA